MLALVASLLVGTLPAPEFTSLDFGDECLLLGGAIEHSAHSESEPPPLALICREWGDPQCNLEADLPVQHGGSSASRPARLVAHLLGSPDFVAGGAVLAVGRVLGRARAGFGRGIDRPPIA